MDEVYDKIMTFMFEIITHWAKMHIPDDTISNMNPRLFKVDYKAKKFIFANMKENKTGSKNQINTLLMLKS